MVIIAFSITLIGMGMARTAATRWLIGVAAFGCALLIDISPLLRVELAMIIGMCVTAALMCWSLRPVGGRRIGRPTAAFGLRATHWSETFVCSCDAVGPRGGLVKVKQLPERMKQDLLLFLRRRGL